jgi:hypothetical protein
MSIPTVFYFSSPILRDTHGITNQDNLFSTIVECVLYSDLARTQPIGHFIATRIIYNEYGNGSGVTDGVYYLYDKNTKYGIIHCHNTIKSILNEQGVVANKNIVSLPIIQATDEYTYLLPFDGRFKIMVIQIDDKGIRTATINTKTQIMDSSTLYIQPTYNYINLCTYSDFNSNYNINTTVTTQRFHLTGTIYSNVQNDTPITPIGFLVSNMNISNSIIANSTSKDVLGKSAYFVTNSSGKKGVILGLLVSTNANITSTGSVYVYNSDTTNTTTTESLICLANGDDYSYLNPQNSICNPYKLAINTTNNITTLQIPERLLINGQYKLTTTEIFKIALTTYTSVTNSSDYNSYITNVIHNFNLKYPVFERVNTINKIIKITEYINRQKNAQYYVEPEDIDFRNPFYCFIYQEQETASTMDFFKFSNKNVIQQNVIRKLFKNINNEVVCEQVLERHIYNSGSGSTKTTGVITESSLYFNQQFWMNIIGANMDYISDSGDLQNGIYLMNALSRSLIFCANCIYYVVVDNLKMIVIPNTAFDFDSNTEDVVIAGETLITNSAIIDDTIKDRDNDNYTFYYKIDNASSYDRTQLYSEYSFSTNLYAKMTKTYNLINSIGLINCDSRLINLENNSFNFLNSFETFIINSNSYNIPEGNIHTHYTGIAVTSINGFNSNNGTYNHEILDTSKDYKYLSYKIGLYDISVTIINNNIRQIKIPKNKLLGFDYNIQFEKLAYITQHNYITNTFDNIDNIDNINKMICTTVPVYLNLTDEGQPINLCDFASIISFINPNETSNNFYVCSTIIIQLSVYSQITVSLTDQCYLTENGILTTNDQSKTQIIEFSIISASGDLAYLNPTNKLIKGFLELTDRMIVVNILKKESILIQPEDLTFEKLLRTYYISSVKISMVSIITEQFNTNGYFSYIYENITDADNNTKEKNIGMYLSFSRIIYNTTLYKSVIFYGVYYLPNIKQTYITTHSNTNATNALGNVIKKIEETVISHINHDDTENIYSLVQEPSDDDKAFSFKFRRKPTKLSIRSKFPPRGWS